MPHLDDTWEIPAIVEYDSPKADAATAHPPPNHTYRPAPYEAYYSSQQHYVPHVPPVHHHWYPPHGPPPAWGYPPPQPFPRAYPALPDLAPQCNDLIYEVHEADVLCGRGAPTHRHSGNEYFRLVVDEHREESLRARRADKPLIASKVVELIESRGGRFLKRTKRPGLGPSGHFCWQEIGEQRAYEKACQALRENAVELRKSLLREANEDAKAKGDMGAADVVCIEYTASE